jgi:hypothetical protein
MLLSDALIELNRLRTHDSAMYQWARGVTLGAKSEYRIEHATNFEYAGFVDLADCGKRRAIGIFG